MNIIPAKYNRINMLNKSVAHFLLLTAIFHNSRVLAQARPGQMLAAPKGSYTAYFRYLDVTGNNMPPNAVKISKGIAGVEQYRYKSRVANYGSGFFIRTNRPDGKVCFVTAGHVVNSFKRNCKEGDKIAFELYLQYYGEDNNGLSQTTSGTITSIPDATLAAYSYSNVTTSEGTFPLDYAILLIDKKMLPTKLIRTLGYDLNFTPVASEHYYLLGHPNCMPMRISDNLTLTFTTMMHVWLNSSDDNKIGIGNSGGPLFISSTTGNGDRVIGILTNLSKTESYVPANQLVAPSDQITYDDGGVFLRLSYIADKIRLHAQVTAAATAASSTTDPYLESEDLDNTDNWNAFQVDASASNLAGLNGVSSTGYANENPGFKLIRAKSLSMNFDYQATTASQNLVTYCMAAQSNLENGFSFSAASNTEFSVYSVVPEPPTDPSSAMRKTEGFSAVETADSGAASPTRALIYPNPSHTGIFTIELLQHTQVPGQHYLLQVFSSDGKFIYKTNLAPGTLEKLDLHDQARGLYWVTISNSHGNILAHQQIVY